MARGYKKNIIKSVKDAMKKIDQIGAEKFTGISEKRTALNLVSGEWTEYRTLYYNVRAEIEISEDVFKYCVAKKIFILG